MSHSSLQSLILDDITSTFEPARFGLERVPAHVGNLSVSFGANIPCCLDMLIKLPAGDVMVPEPYKADPAITSYLEQAFSFEDVLLPTWRETHYAYLTVDQRPITVGKSHRNAGWHFDGMQGKRYPVKMPVCHQYVVSNHLPTEFTSKATDATRLDYARDNWFDALGSQIPEGEPVFQPGINEIMLMSAYQIHRSPVAKIGDEGVRTFLRMDITMKKFDRIGNSINPLMDCPFELFDRPMPFEDFVVRDTGWSSSKIFGA